MSSPSLKILLEKDKKPDANMDEALANIEAQLKVLTEQDEKAFPIAIIDSDRFKETVSGYLSAVQNYREALKETLERLQQHDEKWAVQEVKTFLEQTDIQISQISSNLEQISSFLAKLEANADLEREVLLKLKSKLE